MSPAKRGDGGESDEPRGATTRAAVSGTSLARRTFPIVVSAALVAYLGFRIDLRAALEHLTLATTLRFLAPLALWNAVTLLIEAHCLHRVTAACGHAISRATAARIKSACYLLSLFHYAAGATALTFLLRRRMGGSLARAASAVFVIALLDVGSVAGMALLAGAFLPAIGAGLRSGLLLTLLGGVAAGFFLLRTRRSLGPLDRIRELEILGAFRTIPLTTLFELIGLRIVFVACYVWMVAGLFQAFGVDIGVAELALKVAVLLLISALPIAVAGIGTAQVAFVTLFATRAPDDVLLSMSILLSIALTFARALLGLAFAGELSREAREAHDAGEAGGEPGTAPASDRPDPR
ncbi:MAG: flippase-like domain-containing protein [Deltaproteobacteria bacterium]|nr:flippase-like domain-containing protein [Deltaproteobacteria bacterium]